MMLTIGWILLVAYIVYKIGHSQGQIICLKKLGRKTVTLYVDKEQIEHGFQHASCHLFSKNPTPLQKIPVKVVYEEGVL